MNTNDDYQQYLNNIHSTSVITIEEISAAITKATNQSIKNLNRITSGEVNEVYDVALQDNTHVIIRISRLENTSFSKEKWAIEQVSKIGVPAPEILLIEDNLKHAICVQKKITGEPLERGKINYWKLKTNELKKIIIQAGEILSKIHSIQVNNFGYLDDEGWGQFNTFQEMMSEHKGQEEVYLNIAKKANFDRKIIKNIFEILNNPPVEFQTIHPVLIHNDFGPKHFMINKNKIIGIIDWGEATGSTPIQDFAKWSFWYENLPIEWLMEGYENKKLFDKNFHRILNWIKIYDSLGVIWWRHESKYFKGIKELEPKIKKAITKIS